MNFINKLEWKISSYIEWAFQKATLLTFHNLEHTSNVVTQVEKLCRAYDLDENTTLNMKVAAWFHDVGICASYTNHEEESIAIMEDYLSKLRNTHAIDRKFVSDLIMVTKMPQEPQNLYEQIICDADLSHLGHANYLLWLSNLRIEWEEVLGKTWTDEDWTNFNLEFLDQHEFHTQKARIWFSMIKEYHKEQLRQQNLVPIH